MISDSPTYLKSLDHIDFETGSQADQAFAFYETRADHLDREKSPYGPRFQEIDARTRARRETIAKRAIQRAMDDEGLSVTVARAHGVVEAIGDHVVTVTFGEDDGYTVLFPRELFDDEACLHYGQPVIYEILEKRTGHRSQRFTPAPAPPVSEEAKRTLSILDEF